MGIVAMRDARASPEKWVGHLVEVNWPVENEWHVAQVDRFDPVDRSVVLTYDGDGVVERLVPGDGAQVRLHFGAEWVGRHIALRDERGRWRPADVLWGGRSGKFRVRFVDDGTIETLRLADYALRLDVPKSVAPPRTLGPAAMRLGRNWVDRRVEVWEGGRGTWRPATVAGYEGDGRHTVRYDGAGPESMSLAAARFRPLFGAGEVGRRLRIYWAESGRWFEAKVVRHTVNGTHILRYAADGSEEAVKLSNQTVRFIHGAELVGRAIEVFEPAADAWVPRVVASFDEATDTHALAATEGGVASQVVRLDELSLALQPAAASPGSPAPVLGSTIAYGDPERSATVVACAQGVGAGMVCLEGGAQLPLAEAGGWRYQALPERRIRLWHHERWCEAEVIGRDGAGAWALNIQVPRKGKRPVQRLLHLGLEGARVQPARA